MTTLQTAGAALDSADALKELIARQAVEIEKLREVWLEDGVRASEDRGDLLKERDQALAEVETLRYEIDAVHAIKAERDQALARLAELTKQKPCAAISRCALYGAADCTCGVNGPCEGLTDVYLAAGASPQPSIASVVRSDIDIHLSHCFQPPYDTSCKYGDDDCPATPKAVQPEPVARTSIEQVAGAISKHISTSLYQREVLAAAQYIYHRYCTKPAEQPSTKAVQPSQPETWTDDGGWEFPIAQPSQAGELSEAALLDWLQEKGENWTCRDSETGRGWRLHQSRDTGYVSVRDAIRAAIAKESK